MLTCQHIDKVDDDNAAQITQPQLARDGLRRFQIGFENGFLQISPANIAARVDIDRGHGFGLVKDQMPA